MRLLRVRGLSQWTVGDLQSFKRCDPYEQAGRALRIGVVEQLQVQMDLSQWSMTALEEEDRVLSLNRSLHFHSIAQLKVFAEQTMNMCMHNGHFPSKMSLEFNEARAELMLSTPTLRGLSYNDVMLAIKIDALFL